MAKNNYVSPTITGYNANPPADDGTQTEANRVKWDTVKAKIGDPLNTYSSAIDSAIDAALDKLPNNSTTSQATNFSVSTADDGKIFLVTGNSTASLPSAADAGAGFQVTIKKNESGNTVTVDADGSDTIDGQGTQELTEPFVAITVVSDGSSNWTIASIGQRETPLPSNFIDGFDLSNNGTDSEHDIDFAAGSARDDSDLGNIVLDSTIVKQIDAVFAEGTGAGGLDTGTVSADTVYYVWAIAKTSDGTSDGLFSLSSTSPTLPTGFDLQRRLGRIQTDSSSNIINNSFQEYKKAGEGKLNFFSPTVGTGTSFFALEDVEGLSQITIQLTDLSGDAANMIGRVVLGDSGGLEITGYNGGATGMNSAANSHAANISGFNFTNDNQFDAGSSINVNITLTHVGSNKWVMGSHAADSVSIMHVGSGDKTLSGELTQVQIEISTGNFDAGTCDVAFA